VLRQTLRIESSAAAGGTVCYAAISLPVVGVGLLSGPAGSFAADAIFGGVVAALAIAALAIELRPSRRAESPERRPAQA